MDVNERLVSQEELTSYLDVKKEWLVKKTKSDEIPSKKVNGKVRYQVSHVLAAIARKEPEKALEALKRILEHPPKEKEEPLISCTTPLIQFISSRLAKADKHLEKMGWYFLPPNWPSTYKSYLSKSNYGNGNFKINYIDNPNDVNCIPQPTDLGPHNVQLKGRAGTLGDVIGQTDPANNVPSVVQEYGIRFEYALSKYQQAGFPSPLFPGRPIEVYIANMTVRGQANSDKTIWLYNAWEPSTPAMEHCVNHEFFHLIEDLYFYSYSTDSSGNIKATQISSPDTLEDFYFYLEGLAEWAPHLVNEKSYVYETYFNLNTMSAHPPEKWVLLSSEYSAACVFWKYYSEQLTSLSTPFEGADVIRKVWEYIQTKSNDYRSSGSWFEWSFRDTLSAFTREEFTDVSLLRFIENSQGNPGDFINISGYTKSPDSYDCLSNESLYGNWALAGICKELNKSQLDRRFGYLEDFQNEISLAIPSRTNLVLGQSAPLNIMKWATQYFQLDITNQTSPVKITINCNTTSITPSDALVQLVLVDSGNNIVDIIKSITPIYSSTVMFERIIGQPYMSETLTKNIKKIFVVVTTFESAITGTVQAQSTSPTSDVMMTRWNSEISREYQINFKTSSYSGLTSDISKTRLPHRKTIWVYDPKTKHWKQKIILEWLTFYNMKVHNKGNSDAPDVKAQIDFQIVPKSINLKETIPCINGWFRSNDPDADFTTVPANKDGSHYLPMDFGDIITKVKAKGITTATIFIRATAYSTADSTPGNNVAISKFNLFSL